MGEQLNSPFFALKIKLEISELKRKRDYQSKRKRCKT
jgi:hypothetical protein